MTCRECHAHHANGRPLTAGACDRMLRDRGGALWSMWASAGWARRGAGGAACFEEGWPPYDFETMLRGERCERNWLEGTHAFPTYTAAGAPALLGFDETIYAYCSAARGRAEGPFYQDNFGLAARCVDADQNVLRVMAGWNMCLNLEWQACAMRGRLPGQAGRQMHFSVAPRDLDLGAFAAGGGGGYSVSDVYYAEVCVTAHACRNGAELFELEVGELWECDLDEDRFRELRTLLSGSGR